MRLLLICYDGWVEDEIENKKCHANFILIGYLMKAATVAAAIAKYV